MNSSIRGAVEASCKEREKRRVEIKTYVEACGGLLYCGRTADISQADPTVKMQ